jgi:acyl-CoA thioesterase
MYAIQSASTLGRGPPRPASRSPAPVHHSVLRIRTGFGAVLQRSLRRSPGHFDGRWRPLMNNTDTQPIGLGSLRADTIADAIFARDRTCHALGIQLDKVTCGYARLSMRTTEDMVNGHGVVHGGYLFLLADAAFAYACNTYGPMAVAQSADITFLQPAAAEEYLTAEAVERTRLGRVGVYDVTVTRADGDVIAEFRGRSVLLAGRHSLSAPPSEPSL